MIEEKNYSEYIRSTVLSNAGFDPGEAAAQKLAEFTGILIEENEKYNLTAIKDREKIAILHIADSLTAAKYIPEGSCVCDVGAGGGFPSLPLAVCRPDLRVTALDATAKKTKFLRNAAEKLGISNLTAVNGRAEEIFACGEPARESFDVVTARAVAPAGILSELCAPALKRGGLFIMMKGDRSEEELSGSEKGLGKLGLSLKEQIPLQLRSDDEIIRRNIIIFEKYSNTDNNFPRRYAQIKSKPLF